MINEQARQNFMNVVYTELANDPDNNRANRIIDAADEYADSIQLEIITCDNCITPKRSECIWHNAGATYCSFGSKV